jgi:hypothetical protein
LCEEISRGDSRQNFAQNLSESVSRNFTTLEKISYNFGFREKGKPNFVVTLPEITRCLEDWKEVGVAIIPVHIIGHARSLFGVKAELGLV